MIIVMNREMLIPDTEQYIGTTYDTETENRVFRVRRFSQRGVDLSVLTFRLDLKYANGAYDTLILSKEVTDEFIFLTWEITSSQLQVPGTLKVQMRAIDGEATVKWSTFVAAFYAERHLNTPGNYTGDLTEIEQMEQDFVYMKGVIDDLSEHIDYQTRDAEAWARGTRGGNPVDSTDETYQNNAKYFSDLRKEATHVAEAYARGTVDGVDVESGDVGYHDNSKYYSEQSAINGERWAVGEINGEPVHSTDETYENNSKYWATISESWAQGGTGSRGPVENVSNAAYWASISHDYANSVSFKTYDTVAQMKADPGLLDGGVCRTLGYYIANDGGGAFYKIRTAAPASYYETLSNGLFAELIVESVVTPEMFGAVGDGVADDTNALQNAISSDCCGCIVGKTYKITSEIALRSDLLIAGDGVIKSNDTTSFNGNGVKNVEICGVTILGNAVRGDSPVAGYSMSFTASESVLIHDCIFKNIKKISAIAFKTCEKCIAENNTIETYAYGGIMCLDQSQKICIKNNTILDCIAYASIENIQNTYAISASASTTESIVASKDIIVTGNIIKNIAPHWEGIDAHGGENLVITDNIVHNCLVGISLVGGALIDQAIVSNNHCLVDNFIDQISSNKNNIGIVIAGDNTYQAKGVVVSGNTIEGFGRSLTNGIASDANSGGIRVQYARDVIISDNVINNCGVSGMVISVKAENVKVTNNIVDEVVKRGTALSYGIEVDSNRNFVEIYDNTIIAETDTIDRCIVGSTSTPSYTVARRNRFKGKITNQYFSFSRMIADVMPASPAGYSSTVGAIGDIVCLKAIANGVYGYICTSAGDGDTVQSTWTALSV